MTTTKRKPIGLAWQILIGLILGITVGGVFYGNPHVAEWLKPIGDIFIRMMKMIVVPIVFTTIVLGVSSVGSPKSLGRLGVNDLEIFGARAKKPRVHEGSLSLRATRVWH